MSDYKMIEVVKATGRSHCRGDEKTCIAKYPKKIPEGSKALRISIYGAGGAAVAFYCEECMQSLLDNMRKVLAEV
jgi:hypothetical protein